MLCCVVLFISTARSRLYFFILASVDDTRGRGGKERKEKGGEGWEAKGREGREGRDLC